MARNYDSGKPLQGLEDAIEKALFASRWLLAPFYFGLVLSLGLLLAKFCQDFFDVASKFMKDDTHAIELGVLGLLDMALLGNLLIIMIFAGYENFVSRIGVAEDSEDRPHWMGRVDYSGLKIKLIGSLVAISVIELLRDFMNATDGVSNGTKWRIIIHLTFVISGVLFAVMDFIADKREAVDLSIEKELRKDREIEKKEGKLR